VGDDDMLSHLQKGISVAQGMNVFNATVKKPVEDGPTTK